jgi:hypothetical protein
VGWKGKKEKLENTGSKADAWTKTKTRKLYNREQNLGGKQNAQKRTRMTRKGKANERRENRKGERREGRK